MLTLNANPTNYFAETEQVAFNPSNLVPGIDVTNDPLLQGRLFSYLDTQLTRLGGPNWSQLPINRAHAPINDMLRDGFHQGAVHGGVAPYHPNTLDAGNPFPADGHAFIDVPSPVAASQKVRAQPASFADHFSQVTLFYRSMTPVEQDHIVAAYTFELSKCFDQTIRERQLAALANIDADLCQRVADGLGLPAPEPTLEVAVEVATSPALSQLGDTWPVAGRQVGIVVGPDSDPGAITSLQSALHEADVVPLVVGPHGGKLGAVTVHRTYSNASSVEFDALVVVGDTPPAADAAPTLDAKAGAGDGPDAACDPRVRKMVEEAWRHAKGLGGVGETTALAGVPTDDVVTGAPDTVGAGILELLAAHRAWDRFTPVS